MDARAFCSQGWVQKSSLSLRKPPQQVSDSDLWILCILWIPVYSPPGCHDGSCSFIAKGSLPPLPTLWSSMLASEEDADMADWETLEKPSLETLQGEGLISLAINPQLIGRNGREISCSGKRDKGIIKDRMILLKITDNKLILLS